MTDEPTSPELLDALGRDFFPGHVGIEVTAIEDGVLHAQLELLPEHFAPNGFVHAGVLVTLADTAAGYGCLANLPPGATGFTTLELKVSFLRAARNGLLRCEARPVHLGRTTHVWDATVTNDGRDVALFRCTQLVLREPAAG
jgi:uncharacterized protein (TIGR00369 family)